MANVFKYLNRFLVIDKTCFTKGNSRYVATALANTKEEGDFAVDCKTLAVRNVEKILNVPVRTALKVVNEHGKLIYTSPGLMCENVDTLLVQNHLNKSVILKYPHLLGASKLSYKIELLGKFAHPLNVTIVLAGLSENMISSISNNRISELSNMFEISPQEACEFLYKRPFLCTKSLDFLKQNMEIVRDFGVSLEDVRKDPWILRYSHEGIKERGEYIRSTEVKPFQLKPWMLRCPLEVIVNHFKRRQDNKQILGSASLTEYLSNRLECTEEEAKYLISKMPALTTKSIKTLAEIINFLYNKGFKPHHIYRVPKILVHSVETTKKRLQRMEDAGIKVDSLYMLTKSHKQFMQNFEGMVKMKKANGQSDLKLK